MSDLSKTGQLPAVQSVLELAGLHCNDALRASDVVAKLTAAGAMHEKAQAFFARCESPIERQFVVGAFLNTRGFVYAPDHSSLGSLHLVHPAGCHIGAFTQIAYDDSAWKCAKCEPGDCEHEAPRIARVDFLVVLVRRVHRFAVAVELDGRAYHDDKQQVTRDRARDRRLLADVFGPDAILRFAGAEIFAAPARCFEEVVDVLLMLEQRDRWRTPEPAHEEP